ncbi:MAG: guanylate kinase [Clostridiales bacterium]|jgi:guanylate kinase|nr:guanylate kinase [Clostridiales bacterium]
MKSKGLFIVISGPSGVGKGTIIERLRKILPDVRKSVSVTTREPREGERDGQHYYFRTLTEYQQMIADGQFLETAEVYTNFYGTPKDILFKQLKDGHDVIGELDTLGARQVKKSYPESVRIYVLPPNLDELERRLKARGTEDEDGLKRRIGAARRELDEYRTYNYVVFNDDPEKAAERIAKIVEAERCAVARNQDIIKGLLR